MRRHVLARSVVLLLAASACSNSDDGGDVAAPSDEGPADDPAAGVDAGLSGPGGVITIDGVDYPFQADGCIEGFGDLLVDGFAQTSDGTTYLAGVSYLLNVRNDDLLPPVMSDDEIAAAIESGEIQEDISVIVDLGREDLLVESPSDQPSFRADRSFGNDVDGAIETWEKNGNTISGTGRVIDQNDVALPGTSEAPMEFTATCE